MHKDLFWLDGTRCDSVGIVLQGPLTFSAPTPRRESLIVPGRSGDLHIYDGSFENITGEARCYALHPGRVHEALNAIARWTMLEPGYHRLEVSEEPDYYRMAAVTSGPATDIRMRTLAPFSISFDCQPQKFYISGQRTLTFTSPGGAIHNPGLKSLPKLVVYSSGAGAINIGSVPVTINGAFPSGLTLDCETQDAYSAGSNQNAAISAPEFPSLPHGLSTVGWSGGVTKIEIVPRWWTL